MKSINFPLAMILLALVSGCDNAPELNNPAEVNNPAELNSPQAEHNPPVELAIEQTWSGDYPVAELKRLPGSQQESSTGYLATPAEFEAVWSVFQPAEPVPAVDFGKDMVVFYRNVTFYNRTNIFKANLEDGVLDVLAMETMSALPIEDKVAMALVVVPRAGVKFIQAGTTRIPVTAE